MVAIADVHDVEELIAQVRKTVRCVIYQGSHWYIGVDVCKALGLAPYPSRRSYQNVFSKLVTPDEYMTLPENFGGQGHKRVMLNSKGVEVVAQIAFERINRKRRQKAQQERMEDVHSA